VAAVAVAACTVEDDPAGVDADPYAPDADPYAPDAGAPECAALPDPSPTWLTGYQDDLVARLSGQVEIAPGTTLSDRATIGNRAAARAFIGDELSALGYTPVIQNYGSGANIYAVLAADTPTAATLVLGAHFDSVSGSPGANDNATGVALVLGVARVLVDVDCRDTNVVFAFFDEEEDGLIGSYYFAEMLVSSSYDVIAAHTVDQMGWDSDGDRAIELERPDTGLFEQYQAARASGGFSMPLTETQTGSTDHVRFRDRGIPAIGLTEEFVSGDTTPHYHQPSDTYGTVNFAYLASTTALVAHAFSVAIDGS